MGGSLIFEGLMSGSVRDVIWAHGHEGKRAQEIFLDIQIMEAAALGKLREKADK
jgi:hypothetical protein